MNKKCNELILLRFNVPFTPRLFNKLFCLCFTIINDLFKPLINVFHMTSLHAHDRILETQFLKDILIFITNDGDKILEWEHRDLRRQEKGLLCLEDIRESGMVVGCLLYTSDAADE